MLKVLGIKPPEVVAELHLLSINLMGWSGEIGWLKITSGEFDLGTP